MLNRKTSTLSAKLNGLNLDTRSVAAKATGLNVATLALRARHAHPQAPQHFAESDGGIGGAGRMAIMRSPGSMPPISPPSPWRPPTVAARGSKVVVAEAPPQVVPVVPSGGRRADRGGRVAAQGLDRTRLDRRGDDRPAPPKPDGSGRGCLRSARPSRGRVESATRYCVASVNERIRNAFDPGLARSRAAAGG
jgi:hypothetical protein